MTMGRMSLDPVSMTFTLVFLVGLVVIVGVAASLVLSAVQAVLSPGWWSSLVHGAPYFVAGGYLGVLGTLYALRGEMDDE